MVTAPSLGLNAVVAVGSHAAVDRDRLAGRIVLDWLEYLGVKPIDART